jgi:hypothetical protein
VELAQIQQGHLENAEQVVLQLELMMALDPM